MIINKIYLGHSRNNAVCNFRRFQGLCILSEEVGCEVVQQLLQEVKHLPTKVEALWPLTVSVQAAFLFASALYSAPMCHPQTTQPEETALCIMEIWVQIIIWTTFRGNKLHFLPPKHLETTVVRH